MDDLTRLALAARDGDRAALSGFVARSQGEVWRLCAHLVDRQSADDLVQDVYLRAIPALERFEGASSVRTWLLTITRRACADEIRRRTRRRRLQRRLADAAAAEGGVDSVADPTGAVDLDDLVAALHPDRREAFVLTQITGLPYAEAAEVCGVPVGTIRSRVARARADLLAAARGDGEDRTGTG